MTNWYNTHKVKTDVNWFNQSNYILIFIINKHTFIHSGYYQGYERTEYHDDKDDYNRPHRKSYDDNKDTHVVQEKRYYGKYDSDRDSYHNRDGYGYGGDYGYGKDNSYGRSYGSYGEDRSYGNRRGSYGYKGDDSYHGGEGYGYPSGNSYGRYSHGGGYGKFQGY